ncbi:serine hydrolase domain-containing protein [Citromicrobium bathyomarinum]|uniref:serine hydrolase domain-containing protein n=1 Tax=Citromicrobium bathyomarinum TaxID=72174 RepID=UPI00315B10B3
MKRYGLLILGALAVCVAWAALVFVTFSEGWLRSPLIEGDEPQAFVAAAKARAMADNRGNLAFVMLEDGQQVASFAMSKGDPVDGDALFQVASLGKWLTAWGVMALVEEGRIDLDAPVSTYLSRWQLPDSEFGADGVTVRRLLSHTAGLDDGLGYDGFAAKENRQTLEDSLTRARDASPGKTGLVRLGSKPGSQWQYSGGGYTLLQLVIEEVTGKSFAQYMERTVFDPLGMERTTFDHERALELGLAQNFRPDGTTEPFRWYTALAATSLFTTADDLARFLAAQGPGGQQPVLSPDTQRLMATPHASQLGADVWGLGAMLYAPDNRGGFIIGHDGQNGPAINTAARIEPATGDGIVILSTGHGSLATELAGEWVFWKTGNVDNLDFAAGIPTMLTWLAIGLGVIVLLAIFIGLRMRRRALQGGGD